MEPTIAHIIRLRGIVQGVGMRPTVWRYATALGLRGDVCNDGEGVLIRACGTATQVQQLIERLQQQPPALARIDGIDTHALESDISDLADWPLPFQIRSSESGAITTILPADAATCPDCLQEIRDPHNRRYRYPFTNCTQCGPRFSIIRGIPYDRANTSMAAFVQCPECQTEYENPHNRRYHAQPNACPVCGPTLWLENNSGSSLQVPESQDVITYAVNLLKAGRIIAIKGIGGFHLACDATNHLAVTTLRERKQRYGKPFALMAKDINTINHYADLNEEEQSHLQSPAAPIVILSSRKGEPLQLSPAVAPGQNTLGFMLPSSPLHHLLLQEFEQPLVMTSGNRSQEPQSITNPDARQNLSGIADYFLMHDREILQRCDDSVVRVRAQHTQVIRRARGMAPHTIRIHSSLLSDKNILAMGGELKNTFCLLRGNEAVLSPHMGDLKDGATFQDYHHHLMLLQQLYAFTPDVIVVDQHPNYLSTQLGHKLANEHNIPLIAVQHHHAHIAAVMAEANINADECVLGIALDGLGMGDNGELWGGEILKVSYRTHQKLGGLQSIAMPGGSQAAREPWRNTLAQLLEFSSIEQLKEKFGPVTILEFLQEKPLRNLHTMIEKNINSPKASSAGRLFDAVAAALNICRDSVSYEGQAAIELEAIACPYMQSETNNAYSFKETDNQLATQSVWECLLQDLAAGVDTGVIAARFHHGFANAIVKLAGRLAMQNNLTRVVLSGGVLQNQLLLIALNAQLKQLGLEVSLPILVPANDGGIALGQAVCGAMLTG